MRIPLRVEIIAGGPKPVLYVTIRIPQFHVYGSIRFIVDTGSPKSVISEKDSLVLQIPFKRIKRTIPVYGIGGSSVEAHPIKKAVLTFRNEQGKLEHRTLPEIYACRTAKRTKAVIMRSRKLPSILGVDFLIGNHLKLVFDPVNSIAYLEKVGKRE